MQSKAATVDAYLAELPEDRREAIEGIRKVILKNLPKGYEEGMLYGMIGYYVPHSIYPDGYHCTPTDPLPFANLASQKNHMSFYGMGIYVDEAQPSGLWRSGKRPARNSIWASRVCVSKNWRMCRWRWSARRSSGCR